MLPVVDMPLIQFAVNEAVAAGITELIFITNSSKRTIEDHFDSNLELESNLVENGKFDLLKIVRNILPEGVSCVYIRQKAPRGLGDAILCAKPLVGDEPFAILLADDLIENDKSSCLQQMMNEFEKNQSSIVAVQRVAHSDTGKYGVVDVPSHDQPIALMQGIVEKPAPEEAPSDLAVVGRYILSPRIFSLLEKTDEGANGEIQLTDAIAQLLKEESVYALQFQGNRYDCGTKIGYLEAIVAYALKHQEIGPYFKKSLRKILERIT